MPDTSLCQTPSLGFVSPSRHQPSESTNNENPTSHLTVRPQRFSHSRRLTPRYVLQACFILLPRPSFLFRGFPQQPAVLTSTSRALLSLASFTEVWVAAPSGLYSSCRSVSPVRVLPLIQLRSPLELELLRVFLFGTLATHLLTPPPLMTFPACASL